MRVLHVGLGKTATSTLQKFVYPKLVSFGYINSYNDQVLEKLAMKYHMIGLNKEEKNVFSDQLKNLNSFLLSNERFSNWSNPTYWEEASQKNLELFGRETIIVITLRDAESFMTSMYQQFVHEGLIKKPEKVFVNFDDDSEFKNIIPYFGATIINPKDVNYEKLVNYYKKRFDKVLVVPLEQLSSFKFLSKLYNIGENDLESLQKTFNNAPKENKSYSSIAMKITFFRERILNFLGVKTISSRDLMIDRIVRVNQQINSISKVKFKDLPFNEKIIRILLKIKNKIRFYLKYRIIMQKLVNNIFPYNKFKLDSSYFDKKTLETNNFYYRRLLDEYEK